MRSVVRSFGCSALASLAMLCASSAGAFQVFHSPGDDGQGGGVAPLGLGPNTLNLWISNGTTQTTTGSVCVNGNGAEVCGWDVRASCQGCTFTGFDAGTGDVVSNIEANQLTFHANGGDAISPVAAPERVGILTVTVGGPAQVVLVGDQWVNAGLQPQAMSGTIAEAVDSDADTHLDADDNCPGIPNSTQADAGTLEVVGGSTDPDGIGDVCQCGDVSANGRVTGTDALRINQAVLNLPPVTGTSGGTQSQTSGTLWLRGRCNVSSPTVDACTATDGLRINQAILGIHPTPAHVAAKFAGFCPGELDPP
jgi:hypothetical protein